MLEYFLRVLEWCKVQVAFSDKRQSARLFNEREVWWCSIGWNIGEEEFGKGSHFARPVLVLKKFTGHSFFGIPFTGSKKVGSWYIPVNLLHQTSSLMLNQGRIFDSKRLLKKITQIDSERFVAIKEKFVDFYGS